MLVERAVTELSDGSTELKELFLRPSTYSIPRVLFEAYMTDEESFEPYIPMSSYTNEEETDEDTEEEEEEEEETDTDTEEEETDTSGFKLHQGEILETYYYQGIQETNWENNYEDIDDNGSIKLVEIFDLDRLYKGVRCLITAENENYGKTLTRDTMEEVLLGFITEETFNEAGMELSISGMTKLLEEEYQFNFTQMKRSDIIAEVIKTAGLKAEVDPTGLNDEVIDYTNVSKSSSSDSDDDDSVYSGDVPADVAELAKKICKGKSGCMAKIKAIWAWEVANVHYSRYNNSPTNNWDPSKILQNRSHINCCDTACLTVHLLRAVGVKANYVYNSAHCWCVAYCNGNKIYMDKTSEYRSLGEVWNGMTGTEGEKAYGGSG